MQSKNVVAYIEIRAFAHATEEEDKVLAAMRNILPQRLSEEVSIKKSSLTGHHGNPITCLEAKIKDRNMVKAVLENLASKLRIMDKELLGGMIEQHIDGGTLYLRLDKQSAYLGEYKLCTADPIHLRVHFRKSRPKEIADACRGFGLIP
ncbi:MAG: hypothetical protein N3F10_05090 [Candidatus Bathyarchaeota archaeon]|nr:hypothetical protein [Candidatus Bathyarchaeota archaeon]MCX8177656.1 hypothetical protein [Candidatus Bathyarchaeota archaeon]MDW8193911.1 RNA-binding domain-containing protein [Nitrososphaerota archaeon]